MNKLTTAALVLFSSMTVAQNSEYEIELPVGPLPDIRQGLVYTEDFEGNTVPNFIQFENVDGKAIYQGDIVLGNTEALEQQLRDPENPETQGFIKISKQWPTNVIPFTVSYAFSEQERAEIQLALQKMSAASGLKFVYASNQKARVDIVKTSNEKICGQAPLGYYNGIMQLQLRCVTERTIIHEMMHILGYAHEQSRYDRDDHIVIHWENIDPVYAYNFDKGHIFVHRTTSAYDYKSIMHYHAFGFSTNGKPTISIKNNNSTTPPTEPPENPPLCPTCVEPSPADSVGYDDLGGDHMSDLDMLSLARVYGPAPTVAPDVPYIPPIAPPELPPEPICPDCVIP